MSNSNIHAKQTLEQGIHGTIAYEFANSSERLAADDFTAEDLYKQAIQLDDNSIWILYSVSPILWAPVGANSNVIQGIAAGGITASGPNVVFSNSNGVSFGANGHTITASIQPGGVAIQAGVQTQTTGTVQFVNSNGITFGLNAGSLTASIQPGAAAGIGAVQAGTQTQISGTLQFLNSNGVTFGMNNSSQITISYTAGNTNGLLSNINVSAGNTSNNLSALTFSNSNGISFGLNNSIITASYTVPTVPSQSNQTLGLYGVGNTTQNSSTTLDARSLSINGLGAASVGYSNGSIEISVPVQSAQTQSNVQGISAGTQVGRTGDIIFSNANGITFGMAGSNTITASYTVPNVPTQTSLNYSNSNNVSFGLNGSTLTASASFPNQTSFILSNSNNVTFGTNGSTVTASASFPAQTSVSYSNANNITFGLAGSTVTASASFNQTVQTQSNVQGISAGTQVGQTGNIVFSNSNGITFGMSNSSVITASYTVPIQTQFILSNSNGVSFGTNGSTVTASYTVPTQTQFVLSNSNGISFGTNGSTVTATYTVPNVPAQTSLSFSNANNVSFGIAGSTVTASASFNQTNQTANVVVPSAGTQTATSGTVVFANSNGVTFGMSGSSQITASYTVPNTAGLISNINISAGTTSNNLSALTFSNANNVSFGLNGSTVTGSASFAAQTNQTVGLYGLGNTTQNSSTTLDARSLSFNGLGGNTIGYSNGSIQISGVTTNGHISAINISAGTTSNNLTALTFSNINGVSFGLNGSTLTGSIVAQTNQTLGLFAGSNTTQNSSTTLDARSLTIQGAGIASVGYSNGSIVVSVPTGVPSPMNFSAGTTSNNLGSVVFSNSNGVSFGLNGSTITATVQPGPAAGLGAAQAGTQTATSGTINFVNSNGITFGMSNSSQITASHNGITTQTNQTVGLYALGNTTQNSSTTLDARSLSFNGLGAATIGYSNNSVQISVPIQTQFVLSNSNGISFGTNGSTVTATYTVPTQTNQTLGLYGIGNTTGQSSSSTVDARSLSFSGAGNISVGYSGGSVIISQTGGGGGSVNFSAGTTSNNLSAITFANGNGVSFGLNASTLTASISQSNQNIGLYALGNTTQNSSTTLDARSLSFNGLGIITAGYSNGSIQLSASQSVQTQSNVQGISAGTQVGRTGDIVFSNSNGITFGMAGSNTITASYTVPSIAGLISVINVSAGTTSNNLSALTFSNSNGLSFGLNGSVVTAIYTVPNVPAQTNQTIGLYALGNTTQNSSTTFDARTISFNGLGAATVGYSNGSVQISVPVQTVQTQNIAVPSAGTQTAVSGTVIFSNSNGITFGMSNSSVVTASYTVPNTAGLISNINISAGTTSNNLTALTFSNSNGLAFGLNGSTITGSYTVPTQTNQTLGLYAIGNTAGQSSSSTADARTLSFSGAGIASVGYSAGNIIISVPSAGASVNFSAGTTSNNLNAITFNNGNGVSFGLNGSTMTASVATQSNQTVGLYGLGNTTQNSNTVLDARSLSFNGLGIVTVGYSNGSIQLSATQSAQTQSLIQALYDGANSITTGTVRFSNSNGISFGVNGQTITASHNGITSQTNQTIGLYALGNTTGQSSSSTFDARTISFNGAGKASVGYSNGSVQISVPNNKVSQLIFPENPWQTNFTISNASFSLQHFNAKNDIVVSQANLLMAMTGNTNSTGALTISLGIYTMSGSTMSLASSNSRQITWTSGSQTTASSLFGGVSGTRYRTVAVNNWSVTAGDYMLGIWFRTTNDGTWRAFGQQGPSIIGAVDSNETNHYLNGISVSSFSTAMPVSVNVTDTNYARTGANALQQPGMVFLGSY